MMGPMPGSRSPSAGRSRPRVLLVAAPGPARRMARAVLEGLGTRVEVARDPYDALARYMARPAALVLLSLRGLRRGDLGLVRAVKAHSREARVLLLVPEGRREQALAGLTAGADACLSEPFYAAELQALARVLLPGPAPARDEAAMTASLAAEVAHHINNPLQILHLLGDSRGVPAETARQLGEEVGRIRRVVDLLAAWGRLGEMRRGPLPIGRALRAALADAERTGAVNLVGPAPGDGPVVVADEDHLQAAFGALLGFLAGWAAATPLEVAARVGRDGKGRGVRALVRGSGVDLSRAQAWRSSGLPLLTREATREVYPGLALPYSVARLHGGRLLARPGARGAVLGLVLPAGG